MTVIPVIHISNARHGALLASLEPLDRHPFTADADDRRRRERESSGQRRQGKREREGGRNASAGQGEELTGPYNKSARMHARMQ